VWPRIVALCGLGGAGKTSIAVDYTHRHVAGTGLAWQFPAEDPVELGNTIRGASGQSGGDVVLVGESVEDLLPADPDLGEVDRFRRAGVSLTW
jgi:hypothetical protein